VLLNNPAGSAAISEKKPEFFYGHVVVAASLIVMTLTFGVNYSFGVFFEPLIGEFNWTRALISGAYAVCTFLAGFWGIFAGRISDRLGPRKLSVMGGFCLGTGFLLMSRVSSLWQVYIIYGLIMAVGVGGCWPILLTTVAKWFVAKRGLMTGILAAGVGLGTILTPPLATWLISLHGWRTTYVIIGTGTLVLIVAASLFLKRDPKDIGRLPYGVTEHTPVSQIREINFRQVLVTRQFWMVCGIYFCFGYCLHSVMVHIVPHATGLGFSPATASSVLAVIGGTTIVAKILAGTVGDRFGIRPTVVLGQLFLTTALIWLQLTGQIWGLYLFGFVFGLAYGCIMTMQSLLLAELFGLGSLGVILGGVTFLYTVGASVGPLAAGQVFDTTGSYSLAFIICTLLAASAILLTLFMKPVADKTEPSNNY
jgi:MFS family permease